MDTLKHLVVVLSLTLVNLPALGLDGAGAAGNQAEVGGRPSAIPYSPDLITEGVNAGEVASLGADIQLGGTNEPAVAVDPTNSQNVATASLWTLRVSTDGGATFQPAVSAVVDAGQVQCGDPSLGYDSQGRLFWTYLGCTLDAGGNIQFLDVYLAQSNPATGAILPNYPVNVTASPGVNMPAANGFNHDKEWLAVDATATSPFRDNLYIVWTEFPAAGGTIIWTTHSTDQGLTWSAPIQLSAAGGAEGFVWPSHGTVAPNGDVYLAYHSQPLWAQGVGACRSHPNGASGQIFVARSTNGGVTYPQKTKAYLPGQADMTFNVQTSAAAIPDTRFWLQGSVQPWVLADPTTAGRIYVVANDDPDNDPMSGDPADVFITISTDHGKTWSAPKRIDGGPGTTFQVMPTAAIDPGSGCIAVHYYDNRVGARNGAGDYLLDVYYTVSQDQGATFSADVAINDVPFDPDLGAPCRFDCDSTWTFCPSQGLVNIPTLRIGEYNGVAFANSTIHAVWCGNTAGGQQTLFDVVPGACAPPSPVKFSQPPLVCGCNGDVNNDAGIDVQDAVVVTACIGGDCAGCVNSCDVNCDGVVDSADGDTVVCLFGGQGADVCCPLGEDIPSNVDWTDMAPNVVVADDFISDGRPINAVRWWGSNLITPCAKSVPAGTDCWSTRCGAGTSVQFGGPTIPAIPTDFFGAGSDPFSGTVELGGLTGFIDTLIDRKGDMCLDGTPPVSDSVPIEITQLDLASCTPIMVTFNGGQNPQPWNLHVLLDGPQPDGTLTVTKTNPTGGTFDTDLQVRPAFEFTGPGPVSRLLQLPPGVFLTLSSTGLPWVQDPPPVGLFCGMGGFFPGIAKSDVTCCPESCHANPNGGHDHCVIPPKCPPCTGGGGGLLYASDPQGNNLGTVDPATGTFTVIGPFTGALTRVTEIEWSPDGQTLYATTGGGSSMIYTVDPLTGTILTSVSQSMGGAINGLEFDANGQLLGTLITGGGAPSTLVRVNPVTGLVTPVGLTGFGPIGGLAFDDTFSTLYGITSGTTSVPPRLLDVNPLTGAATIIAAVSMSTEASSLEFLPDGTLVTAGADGMFYRIDPTTGVAMPIGPLVDANKLSGLSVRPSIATATAGRSEAAASNAERGEPREGSATATVDPARGLEEDSRATVEAVIPPAGPDAWFISFHEPIVTGTATAAPPLAVYACSQEVVTQTTTPLPACDAHPVIEYFANLRDCCLFHAEPDSRSGVTPAGPDAFFEEQCFEYGIDIQAVVGSSFFEDPKTLACIPGQTFNTATQDFWGWHSTSVERGRAFGLQQAVQSTLTMAPPDWLYGPWQSVSPVCSVPNMAFELLTDTPGSTDADGDSIPDKCVGCSCIADLVGTGPFGVSCTPEGEVTTSDVVYITDCVAAQADNTCGRPLEACDVNCDGVVDEGDITAVRCRFIGGTEDECCGVCDPIANPPTPEPAPINKSRYISFVAPNPGRLTALRVTLTASADFPGEVGDQWWVANPQTICQNSGQTTPPCLPPVAPLPATLNMATLTCADALSLPCEDWGSLGLIHVESPNIVPDATYRVDAIACDCPNSPGNFSPQLSFDTAGWVDLCGATATGACQGPPDGTTDVQDLVGILDTFKNNVFSLSKARTDLSSINLNLPGVDRLISVDEQIDWVDRFAGGSYPFSGPTKCP